MSTIKHLSEKLVNLLLDKKFVIAYQELFTDDAESIDPLDTSGEPLKGLNNLIAKEEKFLSIAQIRDVTVTETLVFGSYFTFGFRMLFCIENIEKELNELCVYRVESGKIISQQFFIS